MKEMTYDEFSHRMQEVNKAFRIFGPIANNDVTKAFKLYLEVLSEEKLQLELSSATLRRFTGSDMDQYERLNCPECGEVMHVRNVPKNKDGINTQLVCTNLSCDVVLDSPYTMNDWKTELKYVGSK